MTNFTIDNVEYDLDTLSKEARQQLDMVVACDNRLLELRRDGLIAQTARNAYAAQLKSLLPTPLDTAMAQGETLKFS